MMIDNRPSHWFRVESVSTLKGHRIEGRNHWKERRLRFPEPASMARFGGMPRNFQVFWQIRLAPDPNSGITCEADPEFLEHARCQISRALFARNPNQLFFCSLCDYRLHLNSISKTLFTPGVRRVRLNASAAFLITSAWVG